MKERKDVNSMKYKSHENKVIRQNKMLGGITLYAVDVIPNWRQKYVYQMLAWVMNSACFVGILILCIHNRN